MSEKHGWLRFGGGLTFFDSKEVAKAAWQRQSTYFRSRPPYTASGYTSRKSCVRTIAGVLTRLENRLQAGLGIHPPGRCGV
jgi:hypothetical protein